MSGGASVDLRDEIRGLRGREKAHIELLEAVLRADDGAIFPTDVVAAAAVHRSLMLTKGFLTMVGQSNLLCAGALLRLQLDNVMRLYAASLFPSGKVPFSAFVNDEPLSRLKAPDDGRRLTDRELYTRLGKIYPWLPDVYKRTSGYVHLSQPAIFAVLTVPRKRAGVRFRLRVGHGLGRPWPRDSKLEAVQAFQAATHAVLELVYSWGVSKVRQKGAAGRLGKSRPHVTSRRQA